MQDRTCPVGAAKTKPFSGALTGSASPDMEVKVTGSSADWSVYGEWGQTLGWAENSRRAGETRTQWAADERVSVEVVVWKYLVPVIASEVLRGLPQFLQSDFWINHSILLPYPYLFTLSG